MVATFVVALIAALSFGVLGAQSASAQGGTLCDRYPELPQCQNPTGPGGTTDTPEGTTDEGTGTVDSAGNLPFTGYPLNALILLLLVLLAIGLTIRAYLAVRDRLARNRAQF